MQLTREVQNTWNKNDETKRRNWKNSTITFDIPKVCCHQLIQQRMQDTWMPLSTMSLQNFTGGLSHCKNK